MNTQKYNYIIAIYEMDNPLYLQRLLRYLKKLEQKVIPNERIKIVINSIGGESEFMKQIYQHILALNKKGAKIDLYCCLVASAGLILLILLKNNKVVEHIYGSIESYFMWHEPTTYYEFEGKITKDNNLILKGSLSEVYDYLESLYTDILAMKIEYLDWENIYIDLVTKNISIEIIEQEIKTSAYFSYKEALERGIIDFLIE